MLLINKTLLSMSKGMRVWIIAITALKLLILYATVEFAKTISFFLGDLLYLLFWSWEMCY